MKITIKGSKAIEGLSDSQITQIKEELTVLNPKYIQAMKFSKYSNVRIPKYLRYYTTIDKKLIVPRGYVVPFEVAPKDIVDDSLEVTVKYPEFKLQLRDTQKEAYKNYIKDTDRGIIVLPTGKGKSILGCYIAYRLRQKTLVIVHKDDLVSGWNSDINLCFEGKVKPGLIKAKSNTIGDHITISTIQTLNRKSPQELKTYLDKFGLIIVDEMHHCSSTSFDLVHQFEATYKVGLTATPERSDGLTPLFFFHFGGYAYQFATKKDDEDILPVRVKVKELPIKYIPMVPYVGDGGKMRSITEIPKEKRPQVMYHDLENHVIVDPQYMRMTSVDILTEYKNGRSIILFLNQKEHCRAYYELLIDMGVPPEKMQLYYGDSKESKDDMKLKAESKEVLITIATYSIATEGTNVKAWEVAFLLASINNGKNVEQAVGRIRRTAPNKINPVLVYDYSLPKVYIMNNHIRTRVDRYKKLLFTIEGYNKNKKPEGRTPDFSRRNKKNGKQHSNFNRKHH